MIYELIAVNFVGKCDSVVNFFKTDKDAITFIVNNVESSFRMELFINTIDEAILYYKHNGVGDIKVYRFISSSPIHELPNSQQG